MSVYINALQGAAIGRLEVDSTARGNQAVMFLRDESVRAEMCQKLSNEPFNQTILSQTSVNGQPVLITRGEQSVSSLLSHLSAGNNWQAKEEKSPVSAWGMRAALGLLGQGLVLRGSFKRNAGLGKAAMNMEQAFFALSNITANFINIGYGASSSDDVHQLRYLKEEVNNELIDKVEPDKLLSITDDRSTLRVHAKPKGIFGQMNDFMKENSSQVSIGLRYFGAFNLAKTGLHPDQRSIGNLLKGNAITDKTRYAAGLATLGGKTIALNGKTEDPYNPTPPSTIDKIREKFFVGGGLMEAAAFGSLALTNMRGEGLADKYFAAGNAVFVLAYIIRTQAKLGTKKLDMSELYAHVADSVAKLPEDEQAQTVADIAGMLKTHFGIDDGVTFSEIFEGIADDLHNNHAISIFKAPAQDVCTNEPVHEHNKREPNLPTARVSALESSHDVVVSPEKAENHAIQA